MKRHLPFMILILAAVYCSSTGFQCGSSEATSGKLYMQQQQWQKAEDSFLREVQKNPSDEEAWFLLGEARMKLEKYPEMNDAYTKALSLSEEHKGDIARNRLAIWAQSYNEGVRFYNRGKDTTTYYDSALVTFKTAMAMEPDSVSTYYVTALAYYAKKDLRGAQLTLETALQKKPSYFDGARLLGQIHFQMATERTDAKDKAGAKAQYSRAAEAFKVAYDANPGDPDVLTSLVESYDRSDEMDKALDLTRDAVERDGNNKFYRYAYGVYLMKEEKYADAIEQFKKALEIDPDYADAIYNMGAANLNWGVTMKAEAEKKADAVKNGKVDPAFKEKFKAALPYLERSAQTRGDNAGLWQQLGKLYTILNMPDKAKMAFDRADSLLKSR